MDKFKISVYENGGSVYKKVIYINNDKNFNRYVFSFDS